MHLLNTSTASLDEGNEPIDLRQTAADMLVLSFTDSDLNVLGRAAREEGAVLPSLALTQLKNLQHPMSVDLWIEHTAIHAKIIVVRLLGGLEWWRYGIDQLRRMARVRGIALAVLPGEDRDDPRLAAASTVSPEMLERMLGYFRQGGIGNARALLRLMSGDEDAPLPQPMPETGAWLPGEGIVDMGVALAACPADQPIVPILFYRSLLLAGDTAPISAICEALQLRGLTPLPVFVASLKAPSSIAGVADLLGRCSPAAVITTTAFAAADGLFDTLDAPLFQLVLAVTRREGWVQSDRGLGSADLAMNVLLPEVDGRILGGVIAFKQGDDTDFGGLAAVPETDRIAQAADRIARWIALRRTPAAARRVAMILPDYPGNSGRSGWAVGLDVPESARAAMQDMAEAGYDLGANLPEDTRALMASLVQVNPDACVSLEAYEAFLAGLPETVRQALHAAWGDVARDPDLRDGAFHFRAQFHGNIGVMLAPDRGRAADRRTDYHDPALPPRHALIAFGLWLRTVFKADALIHMGAHGTLEWLPGKAVALSAACWPEVILGPLPVIYPFIVNNPGEAAQAKRRIAAITLGHLPPAIMGNGLDGPLRDLERLVDEYAAADGLDPRRRDRLGQLIREQALAAGLAQTLGLKEADDSGDALRRIDAWLCDLKDLSVKDGQHVYGREMGGDAERQASATSECRALLRALDGRRIAPGPAGSPARGRRDVLPTGRNIYAADPRMMPTPTAMDLGRLAADEIVRLHMQQQGEMPRSVVLDLWGSATLRTGGEEIAQGLALMGCQPVWDFATGRITGIEVQPPCVMNRPRVDVTWRISGLFRDLFPALIALLALAVKTVAARDEEAEDNPLRAAISRGEPAARIFGTAPGAYGAGIEDQLASGDWDNRQALGLNYGAAASHSYDGTEGCGTAANGAFAERLHSADALIHVADNPDRDLLEGGGDVAFIGGFAAATANNARVPQLIVLDTTDPARPRARPLDQAIARIVHGRATDARFIAGQMRHGPRGASEFAETVDRLIGFAETTRTVPDHLIDLVHAAYIGDPDVRAFLIEQNPAAARFIGERLQQARTRGLWHPRRNAVDQGLTDLIAEASS